MQFSKEIKNITLYLLIFGIGCLFIPNVYVWGNSDRDCWITWSNYIGHNGIQNIYKLGADYPPLWHYFLWLFSKFNTSESIFLNVVYLKYFVFFFEVLGIFTIYKILLFHKVKYANTLPLLILINIAFWYNNFLFGQIDGIHSVLAFISITFALLNKPIFSFMFLVLCINFKFQGIIFLPIILLVNYNNVRGYSFLKILSLVIPSLLLQVLIFMPFILSGNLKLAINSFTESLGRFPVVNMGAYNIWWLLLDNPQAINDNNGIFGFSYNTYGMLVFFALSGLVLLPFGLKSLNVFTKNLNVEFSFVNIFQATVLIILIFFYFNTQMASRYSHPVILFAGTLAILRKDYLRFFLVSLAVFLNMEGASKILKGNIADFEIFLFQPWFVSLIFLIVIGLYFWDYLKIINQSYTRSHT